MTAAHAIRIAQMRPMSATPFASLREFRQPPASFGYDPSETQIFSVAETTPAISMTIDITADPT
jgi:hypothetical protein